MDISWLTANPANIFTNGDWMLSQSRTTSSRRSDLVVLGTAKLRHKKSISWLTMRGGDVSNRIMMDFTIVSYETQYIVACNAKLAGPRKSASKWNLAQEDHSYLLSREEYLRYQKNIGISHKTNRARTHQCDFDQTSELQSLFNSTVPKVAPFFFQFFMVELGHVQKAGGA